MRGLVLALAFVAVSACTSNVAVQPSATATAVPATATPVATATPTPTAPPATASPAAQTGTITGRLSYPSDFIPPVTVYAIDVNNQRVWYSVEFPGLGNPPRPTAQPGTEPGTYTLTGVAPSTTYAVFAYRNDGGKPDPGFYSREAECRRRTPSGPCPDDSFALVTVTAGQTTREIDIVTWWPGSVGAPPPPRPAPFGYTLRSDCRYVAAAGGGTMPTSWLVSCPQSLLSTYLAASLADQGWIACAGTPKAWRKGQLAIVITDFVNRSDATGQLEQKSVTTVSC